VSFARPQWLLGALLLLVLFAWLYRTLEKRREGQRAGRIASTAKSRLE
jgi:hypothetical protein